MHFSRRFKVQNNFNFLIKKNCSAASTTLPATAELYREKIRCNDRVVKSSTEEIRIIVCNNTKSLKTAQEKHKISKFGCKLLGRAFAACSMMAAALKGDERVILQWSAGGPLKKMYAECTRTGEVRGYVSDPSFDMTDTTPVGYGMRSGMFEVIHILYNNAKPYISAVDIAGGDVSSDVHHYYKQVEGMPTIIDLETIIEGNQIVFSGGLMIQPLPQETIEETEQIIEKYRQKLKMLPPMRVLFKDDAQSLHQIIDSIAGYEVPPNHKSSTALDFYCRCKREEFQRMLTSVINTNKYSLWDKDKEHESNTIDTNCQYCGKDYSFTKEELLSTV